MKKFLAMFLIPAAVIDDWSKVEPAEREKAEAPMRAAWQTWMADSAGSIGELIVGGKTRRVTAEGVSDIRNDIIMYVEVEADSHEAAVRLFERHPHLQIPQSSIEIMAIRPMAAAQP